MSKTKETINNKPFSVEELDELIKSVDTSNVKVKAIPARVSNKKPFMDIQDKLGVI